MYYRCAFNERLLLDEIEKDLHFDSLKEALKNFDEGNLNRAHHICSKLKEETSLATVLAALFSKDNENENEFENRHIQYLKEAAAKKNAFAYYSLAVYFETGDIVEINRKKADKYYKLASILHMPSACHIYGIMLYYGTETTFRNEKEGLKLLHYASEAGVNDAEIFLNSIKTGSK